MNRLVLVPCIVVASYAALVSYFAWSIVVYELGRSRVGANIASSVANRAEADKDFSSPTEKTASLLSTEGPSKTVATPTPAAAPVSPEAGGDKPFWVTVLIPARVHTGPSVDTPIGNFYPVATPLRVVGYRNDWFEVIEPGTAKSGWIYQKYLGAISEHEIASQKAKVQALMAEAGPTKHDASAIPVKRYAKLPVKRYENKVHVLNPSNRVKAVRVEPSRARTEMANLLQRAFSGD
jgi:hypothetical protein